MSMSPTTRHFPKTPTPGRKAEVKDQILRHVSTIRDWEFNSSSSVEVSSSPQSNIFKDEDEIPFRTYSASGSVPACCGELTCQQFSISRSSCTYTNLSDRQVRPSRRGSQSPTGSAAPCFPNGKRSRLSRERLDNLPPLSLISRQACKRMYEGSLDHTDEDIHKRASSLIKCLEALKYDFISFTLARRHALTALVSEGIMSVQLLALMLERMAHICRFQPLRQDIDGLPSDEQAALMVDRWLRRTADVMLDGTIEVAITMMANKACRNSNASSRRSRVHASRSSRRGQSSRQRATLDAQDSLPITARVHYNEEVHTLHFSKESNVDEGAVECGEAPTPARFAHFGGSPKSLMSNGLHSAKSTKCHDVPDSPTSIFAQDLSTPTPGRWNRFGFSVHPAAQAA